MKNLGKGRKKPYHCGYGIFRMLALQRKLRKDTQLFNIKHTNSKDYWGDLRLLLVFFISFFLFVFILFFLLALCHQYQ